MSHPHHTRVAPTEGYTRPGRFLPGQVVPVHATSRASRVAVRVRRSPDDEIVWHRERVAIGDHPVPDEAWARGCGWPVAFEIPIDPGWKPGLYLIDFDDGIGPDHVSSPTWFVLGDGELQGRPLLVLSTNTWNAYNQWGGRCMYSGATELSFERPLEHGYLERPTDPDGFAGRIAALGYDPDHQRLQDYQRRHGLPLWTASSGWFSWEHRFVEWAEGRGYELDFATDFDLHHNPALLARSSLAVFVGHSEYWSWEMRDHLDAFVAAGGNAAIFSGNTCFWQVRMDNGGDSSSSTMICHKGTARFSDPVGRDGDRLTSMWSDPLIGRPETRTTGLTFTRGGYHRIGRAIPRGSGGYTVHRPDHWILEGTGLAAGDLFGGESVVVGYEVDGCALGWEHGVPYPTGEDGAPVDLEVVASAPARLISINDETCEAPPALWASLDPPGDLEGVSMVLFGDAEPHNTAKLAHGRCVLGVLDGGSGDPTRGTVVNVGSADWAQGLGTDPLIEQVTANVIDALG